MRFYPVSDKNEEAGRSGGRGAGGGGTCSDNEKLPTRCFLPRARGGAECFEKNKCCRLMSRRFASALTDKLTDDDNNDNKIIRDPPSPSGMPNCRDKRQARVRC